MRRSSTSISISPTSTGRIWKKQTLRESNSRAIIIRKGLLQTRRSMRRYSARMAISLSAQATWGLLLSLGTSTRITFLSLKISGWFITHLPEGATSSEKWKTHQRYTKLTSAKTMVLLSNTTILWHLISARFLPAITLHIKTIRDNACPKTIYSEVTIGVAVKKSNFCSITRDQEWWMHKHPTLRRLSSKWSLANPHHRHFKTIGGPPPLPQHQRDRITS